jgi:hypothetical protein
MDQEKIMKLYRCSATCPGRKRLWLGDYCEVEVAIEAWFKEVRSKGVLVSGPVIQTKEFACLMNIGDFQASAGWPFLFLRVLQNILEGCVW